MLEVGIGIVFVYLLLSLVCSAAKEGLESFLNRRATDLERGIKELLASPNDSKLVEQLYKHPLVDSLYPGTYEKATQRWFGSGLPSYIPARNFALALLDIIRRAPQRAGAGAPPPSPLPPEHPLQQLRARVHGTTNEKVGQALLALLDAADGDLEKARRNVEAWFNSAMDRVSGWYKKRSQVVISVLGLGLVCVLNADTLAVANSLAGDAALRQSLVSAAEDSVKRRPFDGKADPAAVLKEEGKELRELGLTIGLPIGWDTENPRTWPGSDRGRWLMKVVGLLITALAITLGAPFWFDVLNKFMVVRSTVKPEEKSPPDKPKG
jgi:hypothetical protein